MEAKNKEKALVRIEESKAIDYFVKKKGLDPFLEKIREEINKFVPDISTEHGRKEIATMARKVSSSKTYLEGIGKSLVTELKKKPKLIDEERKRMRDILDDWRDEVRKPLDNYEQAERDRQSTLLSRLQKLQALREDFSDDFDSGIIREMLGTAEDTVIDESWEEYQETADSTKSEIIDFLSDKLEAKLKWEKDQEELAILRKKEEERKAKEREDQIRKDAEEKARREAEEKAEREKREAIAREERLKYEKEQAIKQAEEDKKAAAKRAQEEKEKAEREKREAIEAEKKRQREEKLKLELEEKKRQENIEHCRKINNDILDKLMSNGVDEEVSKMVISLAARGSLGRLIVKY